MDVNSAWTEPEWLSSFYKEIKGILCTLDRALLWQLKNKRPAWCHLLFLFHFLCARRVSDIKISIIMCLRLFCWNPPSLQTNMTNVVIQQNSRKIPMMDILMSETCWAHKKWNKNSTWHQVGLLFFNYNNDRNYDQLHNSNIKIILFKSKQIPQFNKMSYHTPEP